MSPCNMHYFHETSTLFSTTVASIIFVKWVNYTFEFKYVCQVPIFLEYKWYILISLRLL